MKRRLRWLIPVAVGLLTPLIQHWRDVAGAVGEAVDWIGSSHIVELAAAANAFAIFP